MADLLSSLITPSHDNSSQESFHSVSSQPPSHEDTIMTETTIDAHDSALQAAGLQIYEVDSYLTTPDNASSLRNRAAKGKKTPSSKPAQRSSESGEPVSLGSKTSHYVSALNQICQAKGYLPLFEIDGDTSIAEFGGVLRLGDVTVASDERWHSKKEAKEALAEKGMETAIGLKAKEKVAVSGEGEEKNWVGMLLGRCYLSSTRYSARLIVCLSQSITT